MRWQVMVVVALVSVGNAHAASEDGVGAQYLAACSVELQKLNIPASMSDCERLLERSRLIQSEAIRFLAQADDAGREAFAASSTLGRYDMMALDVNHSALMMQVLSERETAASGMVGHLVKDIMKPSCGYYQIDIIMRTLEDAKALPAVPKQAARKSAQSTYKSCLGDALESGKVDKCLNPIFKPVISEPSPNP